LEVYISEFQSCRSTKIRERKFNYTLKIVARVEKTNFIYIMKERNGVA